MEKRWRFPLSYSIYTCHFISLIIKVKIPALKNLNYLRLMKFQTDHDVCSCDKKVSTIVWLMAVCVFVSVCLKSINTFSYLHKADLAPTLGFTSQNTKSVCLCVFADVQLYFYPISCSYLALFPGLHVLLLQSYLIRIGAETCNTQYLNTNPICSAVQLCLCALKQLQISSKVYVNESQGFCIYFAGWLG